MRFAVKDHLGESIPLCRALVEAGHEMSPDGPTDLFLIDLDPDLFGHRELIDFYRDQGAVVIQYPHGAPASTLQYDNLYEPYDQVDGQLTNGTGEIDFLRAIGCERPAKPMGWQLCRQLEHRSMVWPKSPSRVVFAPFHVNADGGLDIERCATNASVFEQLLEGPWELVVRHIGDVDRQGLWHDDRVFRYVQAERDMTTVEFDVADCVVAGVGTYPCLSVARGCPTVMYGQFRASMYGLPGEEPKPLRNLEKYRDIVRYPIDWEDWPNHGTISAFVHEACHPESEEFVQPWKDAWIGKPFDGPAFVKMVEEWIPELHELR